MRQLRSGKNPDVFTVTDYEELGRLEGAVKYAVDRALEQLVDRETVLSKFFEYLVDSPAMSRSLNAQGSKSWRRRASTEKL